MASGKKPYKHRNPTVKADNGCGANDDPCQDLPEHPADTPALTAHANCGRLGLWRERILQAALIILAVLWIYSPTYHGEWLWDDDQLLTTNLTVQHRVSPDPNVPPQSLATLCKLWFNPDGPDYFPLSYTALWAQWPFFGQVSTGYHVTTILLHLSGALLVWVLLTFMRIPGAWLTGLIFAIHPICVESVAWVSETKNTLSLPLFLLACIYWVRQDDQPNGLRQQRFYVLSIVLFLLAMLAKTSVVAFPVVTLLHAWWKRGKVTRRDVVLSVPLLTISLVLGLITISYQWGRAIGEEKIIIGDLRSMSGFISRTAVSGMSVLHYLGSIIWPVNLLPIYPRWEVAPPKAWMLLPWPIIAAGTWFLWRNRDAARPARWGRHGLFALGFFLLMVAPVLGFVTISYMRITWAADHFIYLPMISILALLCAGVATEFERLRENLKPVCLVCGSLAVAALALLAFRLATVWKDEDALWTYTLRHNPDAWQAHNRLGARKSNRGDLDGAHQHFLQATRLRPDLGETHNNLGTTFMTRAQLFSQGGDQEAATRELAAAIEEFAVACRLTPQVLMMHGNLANSLATAGRFQEAADKYREMLERNPNNAPLINNYGVALFKLGKRDEAIALFRRALEITPDLKDAQDSLNVALSEMPQKPEDGKSTPGGAETAPQPEEAAPPK